MCSKSNENSIIASAFIENTSVSFVTVTYAYDVVEPRTYVRVSRVLI